MGKSYKEWWREERERAEEILAARRERYETDPEYRKQIQKAQRKTKKEKAKKGRGPNQSKVIQVDSGCLQVVSIGVLSAMTGKSGQTLTQWMKRGVIPPNYLRDELDRRWFPVDYAHFLSRVVRSSRTRCKSLETFSASVWNKFNRSSVTRVGDSNE